MFDKGSFPIGKTSSLALLILVLAGVAVASAATRVIDHSAVSKRVSTRSTTRLKDTDRDGLSDRYESQRSHTDPRRWDTDGDGIGDGAEVQQGSNPLDPNSPNAVP